MGGETPEAATRQGPPVQGASCLNPLLSAHLTAPSGPGRLRPGLRGALCSGAVPPAAEGNTGSDTREPRDAEPRPRPCPTQQDTRLSKARPACLLLAAPSCLSPFLGRQAPEAGARGPVCPVP